jgi:hypothetical protein
MRRPEVIEKGLEEPEPPSRRADVLRWMIVLMCVRKNARMHVKRHRPALRPGDLFIFVDEVALLRWRRRAAASWRSRFAHPESDPAQASVEPDGGDR